jgi:3-hydroxyisobutyrate dehydrogenase-like beta-hydroxyacid dehydrogenase
MLKVGFIGLGNMGEGMALNLAHAGYSLTVRDVRPEPIARLEAAGATAVQTNFEVGSRSDLVCIAVFDEKQVRNTCLPHGADSGVVAGLRPGGIIAIHSTVSADVSRELARHGEAKGVQVLDAPMTGGGDVAAREGKLTFFVGGSADSFERARPAFEAMTQHRFHVGPLGSGAATKIISNFLAISNTLIVREALRLARGAGIADERLLEVVNSGGVGSSWASIHWQRIREQEANYTTGAAGMVAMATKDLNLAQALALETKTPMPALSALIERAIPDLKEHSLTT